MINLLLAGVVTMAPFGSWKSELTTDKIVKDSIGFYEMQADGEALYWTELHPTEKGRVNLVKYVPAKGETSIAPDISVRTRVHEYGGGALAVKNNTLILSRDSDKQLWQLNNKLVQLTNDPNSRFADGTIHPTKPLSIWVCEEGNENTLCALSDGKLHTIASGQDFYSTPRISPDGKWLVYLSWNFPNMPWDGTTLWLAQLGENGDLIEPRKIAGGEEESIFQPEWSPDGTLYFVSDRTGFWNLYHYINGKTINVLSAPMEAEFGIPAWVFGRPTYTFLDSNTIYCVVASKGVDTLAKIDVKKRSYTDLKLPFTLVQNVITYQGKIFFFGASPTQPNSIIALDPKSNHYTIIKQSFKLPFGEEWISKPETISFPSENGKEAYGFYYPPKNPQYVSPKGELPPLIVKVHGGPTSRAYPYLSMETQFWTSRGFALIDVNYSGSTGYGREYFKRLEGRWGIVDVDDSISAARTLVKRGLADPTRLIIRGGSAGGYTTLAALAFSDVFAAGTSYFGISDLELLYQDGHKFESKYTDRLVGPYPEALDLIRARSPLYHLEKFTKPVLLLQGDEDKIVPPNQTLEIYEKLIELDRPVGMIMFKGEGHGFRQAPNIKRSLDAELYFYGKTLDIDIADKFNPPPVEIHNLP